MRLDAFILAEAATAAPDGKLYVHGGGLTRVVCPVFPFVLPQLALVARLLVDESDLEARHVFETTLVDPEGAAVVPGAPLVAEQGDVLALPDGEERFMQFAITFGGVLFARPGVHTLSFKVDEEELRRMTLPVVELASQIVEAQPNRAERRRRERERGRER